MSSHGSESVDQPEQVETARSNTNDENQGEENNTFATTQDDTDVTEELISEEETYETSRKDDEQNLGEIKEITNRYSPFEILSMVYNNPYYWAIFKSTIIFLLALKMARECKMLRIPMKEYKPFNRHHF